MDIDIIHNFVFVEQHHLKHKHIYSHVKDTIYIVTLFVAILISIFGMAVIACGIK